jgi:hypothetical protein
MKGMNVNSRIAVAIFLVSIVGAHAALFTNLPLPLRALAALTVAGIGPALLLATWLWPHDGNGRQAALERVTIVAALAWTALTVGMLLLSYLPGGVARWQVLVFYDAAMAALGLGLWWQRREGERGRQENYELRITNYEASGERESGENKAERRERALANRTISESLNRQSPISPHLILAGALILLIVGATVRLPGLGYAEFHGDEARAVLRGAAVIQGDASTLLIHRKGPVEILAPAAILVLTGQLDEASARLPFALAGLAALFAIWALGWRLLNPAAGWLAALLLAVTGYYVAFARFLQYQSAVILTTTAAILAVAVLNQTRTAPGRRLLLAALLFATGLLAHYDALAAAPPLVILFVATFNAWRAGRRRLVIGAVGATAAGALLLALYFVPFLASPAFRATIDYLVEDRIGGSPPYNNLGDLWVRGALYNSAYLLLLLAALTLISLLTIIWQGYSKRWRMFLTLLALGLAFVMVWSGGSLIVGGYDVTWAVVTLSLCLACCAPRLEIGRRVVWVWFALAFTVFVLLTARPRTHVHVFFTPWALIASDVLVIFWRTATRRLPPPGRMLAAAVGAGAIVAIFGLYVHQLYLRQDVEVLRTWPAAAPPGYWMPDDVVAVDGRFGFPFANGWKVVGALYEQGVLAGDYETNQRYMWTPDWYTRGQHRCGSTAAWYFAVNSLEPWMEDQAQVAGRLAEQDFAPWGVVTVGGDERMTIYRNKATGQVEEVQRFTLEEYAPIFDAAAGADLPLRYPVLLETPPHPLIVTFNDEIQLEGFGLAPVGPLQPGQTFRLTLYWRAIAPSTGSHKISVQSYYGNGVMVAQKDALPVCDREPTTTWDIGELVVDIHDITVAADAPPGVYPLFVSLYREEGGARLPLYDVAGNPLGDAVQLGEIEIR